MLRVAARILIVSLLAAGVAGGDPARAGTAAVAIPAPLPCPGCWHPTPGTTWQYQLTGAIDVDVDADAFGVDAFEVPRAVVSPFIEAGKPAMVIEYDLARADFCDRAVKLGMFAMRKRLELDAWRRSC